MGDIKSVIDIISPENGDIKEEDLRELIFNFVDKHDKMVLAYNNEVQEPVQSLMLYAVDNDFSLYFGTLKRFPKYESLIKNPPLSIMIPEEKMGALKAVSLKAIITEEIDDKEKLEKTLEWFSQKNSCEYYIKDQDDFVMFKIKILSARLLDGTDGSLVRFDLNLI